MIPITPNKVWIITDPQATNAFLFGIVSGQKYFPIYLTTQKNTNNSAVPSTVCPKPLSLNLRFSMSLIFYIFYVTLRPISVLLFITLQYL